MAVKRVEAFPVAYPEPNDNNNTRRLLLCRIEDESGAVGWGEAVTTLPEVTLATKVVVEGLEQLIVGRDALDNEDIWRRIKTHTWYYGHEGIASYALSAIDIALWDLKGKILGIPLVQLLGGAHQSRLPVIASTIASDSSIQVEADRHGEYIQAGYKGVKVGFGSESARLGFDVDRDVKFMAALRDAVGPAADIMIDRNRCQVITWDVVSAIRRTNEMEAYGLRWMEEPVEPTDIEGLRHFRGNVKTLVAGGEREWHSRAYGRLIGTGLIDVVCFDAGRSEGITGGREVVALVEKQHCWINAHSWSSAINTAASIALSAITPRTLVFEMKPDLNPMQHELVERPFEQTDGWIDVPSLPGLGVEIREEVVHKYGF